MAAPTIECENMSIYIGAMQYKLTLLKYQLDKSNDAVYYLHHGILQLVDLIRM